MTRDDLADAVTSAASDPDVLSLAGQLRLRRERGCSSPRRAARPKAASLRRS